MLRQAALTRQVRCHRNRAWMNRLGGKASAEFSACVMQKLEARLMFIMLMQY